MSARAIWKGHLRFSLVTIPVRVFAATRREATVRFHELHRKCETRLHHKKWCPTCNVEVPESEVVKGYEFERGRYVALEDADIAKVRPDATHVITLQQIAAASAIDPALVDEPYYLAPDGKAAAPSFGVLRDALAGSAGIGTVAFHGRERLVAVEPRGAGLVMLTLRHADELRAIDEIGELADVPSRVPADQVALARKVLGRPAASIQFAKYRDTYEDALRKMIKAKIAGHEIIMPAAEPLPRTVNLMEALRKSLAHAGKAPRPARAKTTRGGVVAFKAKRA